ncbi:hypothetical protein [Streptomyces qinglanensis]|uniref:hypothetical protein n=1 Tax=Streptomyces qinglanensis TaxID=943816 RepID=UPI003D730DD7
MIVLPGAPPVTIPDVVTSPEGWLTAVVDPTWAGVVLAVDYTASTPLPAAAAVRKVQIVRLDPGGQDPVPVRSADLAWALEGVGSAYDHEAPLGQAVTYTARPQYTDGTWGPTTSLSVTVPAPAVGARRDLWLKSLDMPSLSLRVQISSADARESAARMESADLDGSPYPAVAYDVHTAATTAVVVDVPPSQIEQMRQLLDSGVLLAQTRPGYLWPDAYFVPGDWSEKPTGKLGSTGGYLVGFTIAPIERPDTAGQGMRMPGWSWADVAAQFGTYDAVAAAYSDYASLATNGAV